MYYRIYQAKVLEVAPASKKAATKSEPTSKTESQANPTWDTHSIFQDSICFYVCSVAGLAPKDHPARKLVELEFPEIGKRLHQFNRNFDPNSFESFLNCIYGSKLFANEKARLDVFAFMQDKAVDDEKQKLKKLDFFGSNFIRRLCSEHTGQKGEEARIKADNDFARKHAEFTHLRDKPDFSDKTFSEGIDLASCFNSPGKTVNGAEALCDYRFAFGYDTKSKERKKDLSRGDVKEEHLRGLENAIHELRFREGKEEEEFIANFKFESHSGEGRANPRKWFCLRYRFCAERPECKITRDALIEEISDLTDLGREAESETTPIAKARNVSGRYVFPYFATFAGRPEVSKGKKFQAWFPDLEKAAFIKAVEDVFKYRIRTDDRIARRDFALRKRDFMNGDGFRGYILNQRLIPENAVASLGKEEKKLLRNKKAKTIPGFKGDTRIESFEALLTTLDEGIGFTVTYPTLGGWSRLRREFQKVHARMVGKKTDEEIVTALEEKVTEAQSKDPLGFGSEKLFKALTKKSFWNLWLADTPALPNPAYDFLRAKAKYQELEDDLEHLKGAINWTWPDPRKSPREFKFDVTPQVKTSSTTTELIWKNGSDLEKGKFMLRIAGMRMKRDGLWKTGTDLVDWSPPMVAAVLPENPPETNLKGVSVSLSFSKDEDSAYLNFSLPLSAKELKLLAGHRAEISKHKDLSDQQLKPIWRRQLISDKNGDRHCLRWPPDLKKAVGDDSEEPEEEGKGLTPSELWCGEGTNANFTLGIKGFPGCENLDGFRVLGVDLGIRRAVSFCVLEINTRGEGRVISPSSFQPCICAKIVRLGTHRLPGEDRYVSRIANENDLVKFPKRNLVLGKKYWLPELSGVKGRKPDDTTAHETAEFLRILNSLLPDERARDFSSLSFSEQNDELLFALKKRLGRVKRLYRFAWLLFGKTRYKPGTEEIEELNTATIAANQAKFIEEIKPNERDEETLDLAKDELKYLRDAASQSPLLKKNIEDELQQLLRQWTVAEKDGQSRLVALASEVANRCHPRNDCVWLWKENKLGESRLLSQTIRRTPGQRGLSIDRIEQLELLRRCFMSLRDVSERKFAQPVCLKRGIFKPECCPALLERIDRMKEQRVFQTAHLVLQEALALRLTSTDEKPRDERIGQHGVYQLMDGHKSVEIIFLEDLSRYRTSTGRTRHENGRLMKWCHGRILDKLKQMAEPFGFVVATVPPDFSSQFSARDGAGGVRVAEVTAGFEKNYPFSKIIKQRKKDGKPTALAKHVQSVADTFAELPKSDPKLPKRTLFVAVEGGQLFWPVNRNKPDQADVNAAATIAFRGVAHPLKLDIHQPIRCEESKENKMSIQDWRLKNADSTFRDQELSDSHGKQNKGEAVLESTNGEDEESFARLFSITGSGFTESDFKDESFYTLPNGENAVAQWTFFSTVGFRVRQLIENVNKSRLERWLKKLDS